MSELTTEDKLKCLIEAQIKGGHGKWEGMMDDDMELANANHPWASSGLIYRSKDLEIACNVLEILLDPQGLKAAYGVVYPGGWSSIPGAFVPPFWERAATGILKRWLSSNGDAKATIDTAFSLLPCTAE